MIQFEKCFKTFLCLAIWHISLNVFLRSNCQKRNDEKFCLQLILTITVLQLELINCLYHCLIDEKNFLY